MSRTLRSIESIAGNSRFDTSVEIHVASVYMDIFSRKRVLQDISEADAASEAVSQFHAKVGREPSRGHAIDCFANWWDHRSSSSGGYMWANNPWV